MRPRIGITTGTLDHTREDSARQASSVKLLYSSCVFHAGGLPLLLPNLPDAANELLTTLDGLLFSGGGDVDPRQWGEERHPRLGYVDTRRDELEIALLQDALRRDLPVLGICRGIQVMAAATGGDLWQDIPSQCPGALIHLQVDSAQPDASHEVLLTAETLLTRILELPATSGRDELTIGVNSYHHQSVRRCGPTFKVIATSPDGLCEALAAPEATFALGVQWHPEEMVETDSRQMRLFSALIAAAHGL